jgi:hypothetical protein
MISTIEFPFSSIRLPTIVYSPCLSTCEFCIVYNIASGSMLLATFSVPIPLETHSIHRIQHNNSILNIDDIPRMYSRAVVSQFTKGRKKKESAPQPDPKPKPEPEPTPDPQVL